MPRRTGWWANGWILPAALLLATLVAYQPAWHGGLLWDDEAHLIRSDLQDADGLRRIWFDITATQQYYPVTYTAFWVMHQLWGADTLGYHLVNITLHALSAWLVAVILRRLAIPGAALAAVVFALHPVHVESVAWMSEMKNTLSGVLYSTATLLYLRFDASRRMAAYVLAIAAFAAALLAKTVVATLPAALLVIFWWQRGRLRLREDVVPLLPFFVIGATAGLFTAWFEQVLVGARGGEYTLTAMERVLLAGRALWFYAAKIVWPAGLVFNYPRWTIDQSVWWQYLFPAAALAVAGGFWWIRHRTRAPLAALLFFAGTLFPALGFVNVFPFRFSYVADHFQYLASLGVIVGLTAGIAVAARSAAHPPRTGRVSARLTIVTLAFGGMLGLLTWRQSHHYASAEALYRATIEGNPSSWLAHNHLGAILLRKSDAAALGEAIAHVQTAMRLHPDAEAHNNLGLARQRQGRFEEAIREHREAIRLKPGLAEAHYNLGLALAAVGRGGEAIAAYTEAARLNPTNVETRHNLANALRAAGRYDEAIEQVRVALTIRPGSVELHQNLGDTLLRAGRLDEAAGVYRRALMLRPDSGELHNNLGVALRSAGRLEESAAAFGEAARVAPSVALVHTNLGDVFERLGRIDEAIASYQRALALDPSSAAAQQNLARARQKKGT
jgi:tetratricopeptide (TPR) repeat protein